MFKALRLLNASNRRHLSDGSLILKDCSETLKKKRVLALPEKKQTKRVYKKSSLKPKDTSESDWLESLTAENLKLYRKTSNGSFRVISTDNLIEKLKTLYLKSLENQNEKISESEKFQAVDTPSNVTSQNESTPSTLSEFVIENMLSFPLLKSECESPLKRFLNDEGDELEKIDRANLPSVTKVLYETMSDEARTRLNMWKNKMIEKMGKEEFESYQQDPGVALCNYCHCSKIYIQTPRKRKQIIVDLLKKGHKFHAALRKYLETSDERAVSIDSDIEGCWNSVEKLLPDFSNVLMVEESVCHPVLMYKGIVDCVASYRDGPCVIEWKKSGRKKSSLSETYDAPVQVCAYLGALAWKKNHGNEPLKNCLLVTAYSDGSPASVFPMDLKCCEFYWGVWLRRLQNYWARRCPGLIYDKSDV